MQDRFVFNVGRWTGLVLLVGLLSGCFGNHQPSAKQVHDQAMNFFNQEFKGLFLAEQAVKVNGYSKNQTHYIAQMKLLGRAQLSLAAFAKATFSEPGMSGMEKMALGLQIGRLKMTLPAFKQGDVLEFEREYLFIKTDNGWQIKEKLQSKAHAAF